MRNLVNKELAQISGGDYHLQIIANVATDVAPAVSDLFAQVVNGTINDVNSFLAVLSTDITNGANFNDVRITNITFSDFN